MLFISISILCDVISYLQRQITPWITHQVFTSKDESHSESFTSTKFVVLKSVSASCYRTGIYGQEIDGLGVFLCAHFFLFLPFRLVVSLRNLLVSILCMADLHTSMLTVLNVFLSQEHISLTDSTPFKPCEACAFSQVL